MVITDDWVIGWGEVNNKLRKLPVKKGFKINNLICETETKGKKYIFITLATY